MDHINLFSVVYGRHLVDVLNETGSLSIWCLDVAMITGV